MVEFGTGNAAMTLSKLFTEHPASVDETYFGHMAFAAWFSSRLFLAAGAALVHACCPSCSKRPPAGFWVNFSNGRGIGGLTAEFDGRPATSRS
jgi:hypothetical protein